MKRIFLLFSAVHLLSGSFLSAQTPIMRLIDDFQQYKRVHSPGISPSITYADVEGSPYLYPDYRDARVYMKDGTIYEGTLKYDLYTDEMEYENDGQIFWLDNAEQIDHIVLDTDTFLYLTPEGRGRVKSRWFQLLADGPLRLLARHIVTYSEPQQAKPYQDPKPAKFTRRADIFYLQENQNPPTEVTSKKSVIDFFGDRKNEVASYIKKNHLNIRKEDDLLKLVGYVNRR